jgi:7,8-dihydropterin-6-yl-methyl-4-(beta-D-ribofuranosyl)aminobenzene 5'-phosphate synthase
VFCCRDISAQTEDHAISGSSSVVFASDSSSVKTDIWTSGQFECVYDGKPLHEQALVIERPQGLVVLLGCAHPGIKIMLERIRAEFSSPVYMVIGGFHLKDSSADEINDVIRYMRLAGIKKLAPTHCTGAAAIELMRKEFKDDLIEVVEGMTFEV